MMRQKKKMSVLVALCMAFMALAIPTTALGASVKTESGAMLPLGSKVQMDSAKSFEMEFWLARLRCADVNIGGTVSKNNPETFEAAGTASDSTTYGCSYGSSSAEVTTVDLLSLSLSGSGPGTASLFISMNLPAPGGTANWYTEEPLKVSYEPGTSHLHMSGVLHSPTMGEGALNATFELAERESLNPLFIYPTPPAPKWTRQWSASQVVGWLHGVSCVSDSECVAVGTEREGAGKAFAELWTGGEWTVTAAPAGSGLSDVSCASSSFCLAIPPSGLNVQRWNGSSWSSVAAVAPTGSTRSELHGISCASPTSCIAVGSYTLNNKALTLAERYDGEKWTVLSTPNKEGGSNRLDAVSCVSSSSCIAVGAEVWTNVALQWNGVAWSALASRKEPTAAESSLSCVSGSACMLVNPDGTNHAEWWNGSTWSTSTFASPNGPGEAKLPGEAEAYGVSCSSATNCRAVGYAELTSGEMGDLIERWNGTGWVTEEAQSESGTENYLDAISCSSSSHCTAVGSVNEGLVLPVVERYE